MYKVFDADSLGNRFVLFDNRSGSLEFSHANWPTVARQLSKKFKTDGVLILQQSGDEIEMLMFNPDGSNGQLCLNGLRCAVSYLAEQNCFPKHIVMSGQEISCGVSNDQVWLSFTPSPYPSPASGRGDFSCSLSRLRERVGVRDYNFNGFSINIGNPHLVIFEQTTLDWLQQNGPIIENLPQFPDRTNIEFVWPNDSGYQLLVYERGCGCTQACGSGAAAVMLVMLEEGKIKSNEHVILQMPGGNLESFVDEKGLLTQITEISTLLSIDDNKLSDIMNLLS